MDGRPMAEEKAVKDPKLAAVEAELASDRGEVYDPATDAYHEIHTLAREGDVGSIISAAVHKADVLGKKKSAFHARLSLAWLKRLLSFGLWKPKKELKKDYTYEFDPRTGGERRVYVVRDGRTDRE